jgi:hypothetical protein
MICYYGACTGYCYFTIMVIAFVVLVIYGYRSNPYRRGGKKK